MDCDFLVSYASEDKEQVARPLVKMLEDRGWKVWFDEDRIGQDSIRQKLDEGLRKSNFLILIFSHSYFEKFWTNKEADVAFERRNRFLVRHKISIDDCKKYSVLYGSDNLSLSTENGLEGIVKTIEKQFNELATQKTLVTTDINEVKEMPQLTDDFDNREDIYAIGIDVGTAYLDRGVVKFSSDNSHIPEIVKNDLSRIHWNGRADADEIVERICDAIHNTAQQSYVDPNKIKYVGLGLPGQVDPERGVLLQAPALGLHELEIANDVKELLVDRYRWSKNVKVLINNDVTCSALAETTNGEGRSGLVKNFVCVAVGKGVGAGIVVHGNLYQGYRYNAGEVGHMKIDISNDARPCTCGRKGCFESYSSERGVLETARKYIAAAKTKSPTSPLARLSDDVTNLRPEDVSMIIGDADSFVCDLREELAKHLAVGLANIANMFNPRSIIITGGIGLGFYQNLKFQSAVKRYTREYTLDSNKVNIVQSQIRKEAQIIGAAMLGVTKL